jgi:hypothetical protein
MNEIYGDNFRFHYQKCHEWPNDAVIHECAQCMSDLQHYLVISDIFDNDIR